MKICIDICILIYVYLCIHICVYMYMMMMMRIMSVLYCQVDIAEAHSLAWQEGVCGLVCARGADGYL